MPEPRADGPPSAARRTTAELAAAWCVLLVAGILLGLLITATGPGADQSIVDAARGDQHGAVTGAMRAVTWLGSPLWLDVVFALAAILLIAGRAWRSLRFLLLASPGTVVLVQLVRAVVARGRPAGPHLTVSEGHSWPSGHASSTMALYGALLLIALARRRPASPRARAALSIAVVVLLALIGVSRVVLGVHHPTDVIAGWLLAGTWLAVLQRRIGAAEVAGPGATP